MKVLYRLKDGMEKEIKKKYRFDIRLAKTIGIDKSYISQIINRRELSISKLAAFAISKALSPDYEIQDVFDVIVED